MQFGWLSIGYILLLYPCNENFLTHHSYFIVRFKREINVRLFDDSTTGNM